MTFTKDMAETVRLNNERHVRIEADPHGGDWLNIDDVLGEGVKLVTFHRHGSEGNIDESDLGDDADEVFDAIESNDRAFFVSCYSHGAEQWGLVGQVTQCQWDTAQYAGAIIIPDDFTNPREAAEAIMHEFTVWRNGWYQMVTVYDGHGNVVDSIGGISTDEAAEYEAQAMREHYGADETEDDNYSIFI